jgi:hypothetical protein
MIVLKALFCLPINKMKLWRQQARLLVHRLMGASGSLIDTGRQQQCRILAHNLARTAMDLRKEEIGACWYKGTPH